MNKLIYLLAFLTPFLANSQRYAPVTPLAKDSTKVLTTQGGASKWTYASDLTGTSKYVADSARLRDSITAHNNRIIANTTASAAKANDNAVVHLAGTDTIRGAKNFSSVASGFQGHTPQLSANYLPTEQTPLEINNGLYNSATSISAYPSGKLVALYGENLGDGIGKGTLRMRTSTSQGQTWSTATTIKSDPVYQVSGSCSGLTNSGRLINIYVRTDTVSGATMFDMNSIYSDDEGATWSSPTVLPTLSNTTYFPYGQLSTIAGDTLLASWYGWTGSTYTSYVIKSGDNGVTWGTPIVAISSASVQYTETSFHYLGGNIVLGMVRKNNGAFFRQVISLDNGTTWVDAGNTPFGGINDMACLTSFKSPTGGRVVECVYSEKTNKKLKAIYADAATIISSGVSAWDANSITTILTDASLYFAYPVVVHPYDNIGGIGWAYKHNSASNASIIPFKTPVGILDFNRQFKLNSSSSLTTLSPVQIDNRVYIKPTTLSTPIWANYTATLQLGNLFFLDYNSAPQSAISENIYYNGSANKYAWPGYGASINLGDGSGNILINTYPSGAAGATAAGITAVTIANAGSVAIGTNGTVANTKSILELSSTVKGFLTPRMTTTQRDLITSVPEGLEIYNLTTHAKEFSNGTAWVHSPIVSTGTAAPSTTPSAVGDTYIDTTNKKSYVATGTSSSADWTILN